MTINTIRKLFIPIVVLMLLLVACSASYTVLPSDINRVAENINCICGSCDLIVSDCDCERAEELTAVIEKRLSKGQSKQQIIQDLVQQYGQRVLAT